MPDAESVHDDERRSAEAASWAHWSEARDKRKARRGLVRLIQEARLPDQFDPLGREIDRSMEARGQ